MPIKTRRPAGNLWLAMTSLIAVVLAAGIAAVSVRAQAADDTAVTYICHQATAGETPNAKMTAASSTALECRAVSLGLKMSNGSMRMIGEVSTKRTSGPDLSKALTPGQVNDAWVKWTEATFNITHSP